MTDVRTAEQVTADEALTAAIAARGAAYYPNDEPRLLTDYLVLFVEQSFEADGSTTTVAGLAPRDNDLPVYRQLGLLEWGRTRIHQRLAAGHPL